MPPSLAQNGEIPRTADGKPDFSGTYDVSTLTPFQRPSRFGNRLILTNDEAFGIANAEFERKEENQVGSDPDRSAPLKVEMVLRVLPAMSGAITHSG